MSNNMIEVCSRSRSSLAVHVASVLRSPAPGRGRSERVHHYVKDAGRLPPWLKRLNHWRKGARNTSGLCRRRAVKGAVEKTVATFGRLDVLVNNAARPFQKRSRRRRWKRWIGCSTSTSRRIRRDAGGAEAHEERRSHHHDRSSVGERNNMPGLVPYSATKGRQDVHAGVVQRVGAGHHVKHPAGPIDTDLNPAWRLAVPQKPTQRSTVTDMLTRWPRCSIRRESGVLVHYGANLTVDGGVNA